MRDFLGFRIATIQVAYTTAILIDRRIYAPVTAKVFNFLQDCKIRASI